MQWTDEGIVISARPHGERSLVLKLLTKQRGIHAGLVRFSRKDKGIYQLGASLSVIWKARLEEHLGNFQCESRGSGYLASVFMVHSKLSALTSACALMAETLPERDPHPRVYEEFENFLESLKGESWLQYYVLLEMYLLQDMGFGLDLDSCAVTGTNDDLIYISPKSGRAVSGEAGADWHDKLLPFPELFNADIDVKNISAADVAVAMRVTGFFLQKYVFSDGMHKEPESRKQFVEKIAGIFDDST